MRHLSVFFDLDGTLVDPYVGITSSYRALLEEAGLPVPEDKILRSFIGPPLRECLKDLLRQGGVQHSQGIDAAVEEKVTRYRHYYVGQKFMLRDTPYAGISEVLQNVRQQGARLFVATSKAQTYARDILVHFGLERHFVRIYGSELDGTRSEKAELLGFLLEQERISPENAIMVGDRLHDVLGARAHRIPCIGVAYGYGSTRELKDAGAVEVCHNPSEIPAAVQKLSRIPG